MTWITTHLALEGLILWIIIGKELRSRFLLNTRTKSIFLLANFMAIVPDFDVIFGFLLPGQRIHRGPSHSLTFPLFFLLLGYVAWLTIWYTRSKQSQSFFQVLDAEHNKSWKVLLVYFFFLAAFFWFFHLVLDMDSAEGGMMLLWPLDDQLYQIRILAVFSVFPFLFLPWTLLGFDIDVIHSNIQGLLRYLINLTPDEIIQLTGSTTFNLSLVNLVLHMSIMLVYLHYVIQPMF